MIVYHYWRPLWTEDLMKQMTEDLMKQMTEDLMKQMTEGLMKQMTETTWMTVVLMEQKTEIMEIRIGWMEPS